MRNGDALQALFITQPMVVGYFSPKGVAPFHHIDIR